MESKPDKKTEVEPAKQAPPGIGGDPSMKTTVIAPEKLDRATAPDAKSKDPKSASEPARPEPQRTADDASAKTLVLSPDKLDRLTAPASKDKPSEGPSNDAREASKPAPLKRDEPLAMKTMVLPPAKLEGISSLSPGPVKPSVEAAKKDAPAAPPPVETPAAKPAEAPAASKPSEAAARPIPWPFLLALLIVAGDGGLLAYQWTTREPLFLRTAWISLCSIVPGLAAMVVIGSLAQFRRRPILSTVSLLLGGVMLGGCWWAFQVIAENAPLYLR